MRQSQPCDSLGQGHSQLWPGTWLIISCNFHNSLRYNHPLFIDLEAEAERLLPEGNVREKLSPSYRHKMSFGWYSWEENKGKSSIFYFLEAKNKIGNTCG